MARRRRVLRGPALLPMLVLCGGLPVSRGWAQPPQADMMSAVQVDSATAYLRQALAGPAEPAYLQVLADVSIVVDPHDTTGAYDLIASYDPQRFHDRHLGMYPLSFEDQFIQWGKRIALFTRSSSWRSRRYYLHDISTGEQAWIFTEETRRLYPPQPLPYPPSTGMDSRRQAQTPWLQLIHGAEAGTRLTAMSEWLRLMRREARETVLERGRLAAAAAAAAGGAGP